MVASPKSTSPRPTYGVATRSSGTTVSPKGQGSREGPAGSVGGSERVVGGGWWRVGGGGERAHVEDGEGPAVVVGGHGEDGLQLGHQDVAGGRGGEAPDQGVRQVADQEAHLEQPHHHLGGGGGYEGSRGVSFQKLSVEFADKFIILVLQI